MRAFVHGRVVLDRARVHVRYRASTPANTIGEDIRHSPRRTGGRGCRDAMPVRPASERDEAFDAFMDVLHVKNFSDLVLYFSSNFCPVRRTATHSWPSSTANQARFLASCRPALNAALAAGRARPPEPPHPAALRVVIELRAFDKGGLEKVVLDTAKTSTARRIAPLIVSVGATGALAEQARPAGLRVEALPTRNPLAAYRRLLDDWRPAPRRRHISPRSATAAVRRGDKSRSSASSTTSMRS